MTTTGLFIRHSGAWVGTGVVVGDGFTLGSTKPLDANTGAGVLRPAPTTSNTTANTTTSSIATSGGTYVSVNFTKDLVVSGDNNSFIDCLFAALTFSGANNTGQNCVVKGNAGATNHWIFYTTNGSGSYLEYSNLNPTTPTDGGNAVGERNYQVYRSKVWNSVDGFSAYAADGSHQMNVIIQGCFIPRMAQFRPDTLNSRAETHNDGSQLQGGIGATIVGNNFMAVNATDAGTQPPLSPQVDMSCIMMNANTGHLTLVVITDNWFDYGIIAVNGTTLGAGDSVTLKRNKFGPHITAPNTSRPIGLDAASSYTAPTSGADANVWEVTWTGSPGGTAGQPVALFFS